MYPTPPSYAPPPPHAPPPPGFEPTPPWWKRALAPVVAVLAMIAKFFGSIKFAILPLLKFFPILLKTGGSMILMIGVYTMMFGWQYAVGIVLLLFVHECGHVVVARHYGLKTDGLVFVPFFGALTLIKEAPGNAWRQAMLSIGGPIAGTVGALVCHVVYSMSHNPVWLALAYTGYFLNLFNLMPVDMLDGGKIVDAISPWLLLPGLALLVWFMLEHGINFVLVLILLATLPRVWKLFWSRTPEEEMYHRMSVSQRLTMGLNYFGLAAFLFYQMQNAIEELQSLGHWR